MPENDQIVVSYLNTHTSASMRQSNPQRRLIPQCIFLLIRPSQALLLNPHVKVPENTCQNGSYLEVRKTKSRGFVRKVIHVCDFFQLKE